MADRRGPNLKERFIQSATAFWTSNSGPLIFIRELLSTALIVAFVGLVLFAVSGLWPPLVAVESGSMQPHLERGDLVFVMEEHRFSSSQAINGTGIVTYQAGKQSGYSKFDKPGDVLIYNRFGNPNRTPVIHRARFWVNKSENWYSKTDHDYTEGAQSCRQLEYCPAPHSGFITKGDHNSYYDQVGGISSPVKPSWVKGTAEFRIPWLGEIRLLVAG